ncbi:polyprenyl synthetase family protein [Dehalobacterium formicoaceticum]|uniref:Polyprenyl synthetase family protein n=1 Tax=Dehalobacterium formicoaceticum TaxID=51515 RepID=A0ABT1Y3K7_9FIRM|nr:polyprenyl synthetase family protein [Dehalobacterium formicoaceticum]MCR6545463.1 polyprenyl synthetase family protein [Dehalobacterium formicoaceticum]
MEDNLVNLSPTAAKKEITVLVPEMHQVEELLYQTLAEAQGTIGEMGTYFLNSGGKRLRPLLIILSGKATAPLTPEREKNLIAAGAAVELIHMASLVHDDIIDQSLYRRGQPSVHALWGAKGAVLAGDFLFAKAFDILVSHNLFSVLKLMVLAIQEMCQGEILQSEQLFQTGQNEKDYFQRIEQKTGTLLAACCQSGALITQGNLRQVTGLKNYGTYLGYTYQITDDLLDFSGNSLDLGKPVCQDLRQGNLTLPILYLLQNQEAGSWVRQVIETKRLKPHHCAEILKILREEGFLLRTEEAAARCATMAKNELAGLSPSLNRTLLEIILEEALKRTS